MAAVDAQFYWMSAKIPNDEFLLYAFDGEPSNCERAVEQVCRRARACPDLTMRIQDRSSLTYPQWVPTALGLEQVVCHDLPDHSWRDCLAAVVALADAQLDVRRMPWRLHVFTPVLGIPGVSGTGAAVVMQVPWRAVDAARTHRRRVRDTRAGLLAPTLGDRPPQPTNARPDGVRSMRTLVRRRAQLRSPTITVGVLTAVSTALSRLLGDAADSLGAEVPMAKPGVPQANNHFGNVVVGLYPKLGLDERAERIAIDLANGRRRFEHPATRAADRALAAVPAALLRWGISQFDPDVRAARVAGNTVVSSVNRGAADLSFGDARVVLTAGYPALSPMMGLTHGVHGIGDIVAISVHAAESAVPDIDEYMQLLDAAL